MNPIYKLINLLAPEDCLGCQVQGNIMCQECTELIDRMPAVCYGCGKPSRNFKCCPNCLRRLGPQHVWTYAAYKDLARALVKSLKFDQKREAAQIMAELLSETLPYFANSPTVTYVPTSPTRRRARGFDHAQLIAKDLARLRGWPLVALLERHGKLRQLGNKREIRKTQLAGMFRVVNCSFVPESHILLVDDVVTTGATIETCAKELLRAGASQVDVAAFAYTIKK